MLRFFYFSTNEKTTADSPCKGNPRKRDMPILNAP
jgi:hypothetical protein